VRSREFSKLVASLPSLNLHQMQELSLQVVQISGRQEIQDLVSERIDQLGKCPHCDCSAFLKWGYTPSGEQRYRCKACSKSFTGLTGTPFAGTHNKASLLANADCMQKCLSVRQTAKVLGVHRNTALRFRQLMIPSLTLHQPSVLAGVAEADEASFRKSYKGLKAGMPRPAYSRGPALESAASRATKSPF
jgi:transposase-like protein